MKNNITALVLFSGGLDSVLAAKLLQRHGVRLICLHFTSPFFGDAKKIPHWESIYNFEIHPFDAAIPFIAMLANGPEYGFGKALNPCVDCKILLLRLAKSQMEKYGAQILATGEVVGQRPMSQRKDAMSAIARDAGVRDILFRPLCAKNMPPLPLEEEGILNHADFPGISGRGRNAQLELAEQFGLSEIPTPAGGCLLTEKENTRRYWKILRAWRDAHPGGANEANAESLAADMRLAACGRQVWHDDYWLCFGRNQRDNEKLVECRREGDAFLRLTSFPGPHALARGGAMWPENILKSACSLLASHSPKAVASGRPAACELRIGDTRSYIEIMPGREGNFWATPTWEETSDELREERLTMLKTKRKK